MILNEKNDILNYFYNDPQGIESFFQFDYKEDPHNQLAHKNSAAQYYKVKNRLQEINRVDANGVNPMLMAILHNSYIITEWFLIHGGDVEVQLIENKSLLHYAVIMQNQQIVKLLLDYREYHKEQTESVFK